MVRADPTMTQTIIILVAATVPLVYAFTHHSRARESTLVLWLPFVLFVSRAVYPPLIGLPSAGTLEERLRWATITLFADPATIGWPVLVWVIFFLVRLRSRRSGRKTAESSNALGQGRLLGEPLALFAVVALVILMLVVAQFVDQTGARATAAQRAHFWTPAEIIVGALAAALLIYFAFTSHGHARMATLALSLPLWLFADRIMFAPTSWSHSLEQRLRWTRNEFLANPALLLWPLYVFFVYGLIRLFTPAYRPAVSTGSPSAPPAETKYKQCLGCRRFVAMNESQCPHCRYSFASVPGSPTSAPAAARPSTSPGGEWCSHCGAPVRTEANFCARCGLELSKQH
jgi:RNA polymerase subunit RPABC4/transcription elongation factor Spt4